MSSIHRDTVILDPGRFDSNTHAWDVPILTVRGITPCELWIDGHHLAPTEYSIHGNHVNLNQSFTITAETHAKLVIQYDTTNMRVVFWLPIIVAVIGLIGTIGQPLLHSVGLLYVPSMTIRVQSWSYDDSDHAFHVRLHTDNLRQSDVASWSVFVGVRKRNNSIEPGLDTYRFLSGPFELKDDLELSTITNQELTTDFVAGTEIQGVVFLVRRGIPIAVPFDASQMQSTDIRLVATPGIR